MIEYQANQKNVESGSRKYQNRYPFSGRIECAECGDTFRRIHTSTHIKYIAWCCTIHIQNKEECSMLFIKEVRIYQAFITMINKLKFGHSFVLVPLLKKLETTRHDDSYEEIIDIEKGIEANREQIHTLVQLMTKGFLESPFLMSRKPNFIKRKES